jgi:hypothetical protein
MQKNRFRKSLPKVKQNNKPLLELPLFIKKNKFYSNFVKLRRGVKVKTSNDITNVSRRINLKGKTPILFLLVMFIILGLGIFVLTKYLNIKTTPFNSFNPSEQALLPEAENNILLIGLDDRVDGYQFANLIIIVSLNKESKITRIYGVNPRYSLSESGQRYSLSSYWNKLDSVNDRAGLFTDLISEYIGIRLDAYIAFERSELNSFLSERSDLRMDVGDTKNLNGEKLSTKLLETVTNDDDVMVQTEFVHMLLQQFKNITFAYDIFLNTSDYTETFKTNISRDQFYTFISFANQSKYILNSKGLTLRSLGYKDETSIEDLIIPNYILVDENVADYFTDLNILAEQARVEVYNSTTTAGLASKYKRILQNTGANVIKFGNYPEVELTSKLYVPEGIVEKFPRTINMIKRSLGFDVEIAVEGYRYNYSGDIILILGEDIVN